MTTNQQIKPPDKLFLLDEANLPADLIESLMGQSVAVEVLPEELPRTRKVDPSDVPLWIDPEGNYWNDYRPIRILYTDPEGRVWRLPRRWLNGAPALDDSQINPSHVENLVFDEKVNLPNEWDLWEVNIPWAEAVRAVGRETTVQVSLSRNTHPRLFGGTQPGRLGESPMTGADAASSCRAPRF